jgi:hypothetical protein
VIGELNGWRNERGSVELDDFVFATASGKPRDRNNIGTILSRIVENVDEQRGDRGYAAAAYHAAHAAADLHHPDAEGRCCTT